MISCQDPKNKRITDQYEYTNTQTAGRTPYAISYKPRIIAIVGSTASGKTDIALEIAKKYNGEIILADSRQVYKGMNIGTNKVSGIWKIEDGISNFFVENIPYHGIDLVEPNESFTVQEWKTYTQKKIAEIIGRGRLPVIEGGTGLYVWALLDNLTIPEVPPDPKLRKQIEQQIERDGLKAVTQEILEKDPEAAAFLQLKNPRRVIRALEIIRKTGVPFSQQRGQGPKLYNDIRIGINRPLTELDERITKRAKKQLKAGLENEVRDLARKYGWSIPAMSGIGYAEWHEYLTLKVKPPKLSREEVLENIVRHTKQYARAQRKWFRRDKNIHWVSTPKEAARLTPTLLSTIGVRPL